MRVFSFACCLIAIILVRTGFAAVLTARSMREVSQHLVDLQIDQQTLVAFDVDMVIIEPLHPAYRAHNIAEHFSGLKQMLGRLPTIQSNLTWALSALSGARLVEENVVSLIEDLQNRDIKVIGMTGLLTGNIDTICPSTENSRVSLLKKLGIDFSCSFPDFPSWEMKHFRPFRTNYPSYREGILFANGGTKRSEREDVLHSFVTKTGLTFSKIIVIDDRMDIIEPMCKTMQQLFPEAEFVAIHYTKTYHPQDEVPLSWERFSQSWMQLISRVVAISDEVDFLNPLEKIEQWLEKEQCLALLYSAYNQPSQLFSRAGGKCGINERNFLQRLFWDRDLIAQISTYVEVCKKSRTMAFTIDFPRTKRKVVLQGKMSHYLPLFESRFTPHQVVFYETRLNGIVDEQIANYITGESWICFRKSLVRNAG